MRIFRLKYTITILIIILISIASALAQRMPGRSDFAKSRDMFGPATFLFHTTMFKSELDGNKSRLDVYISFANDILQFVKEKQGDFSASYELVVSVFDRKNNLVKEFSEVNKISVADFQMTNDRQLSNNHKYSYHLSPADYKLIINLTDHDTQKTLNREKKIAKNDFVVDNVLLSDVLFGKELSITTDGEIADFTVNLTNSFVNPDSSFWAYFEMYPQSKKDSLQLRYQIVNANGEAIAQKKVVFLPTRDIMPYLLDLSQFVKVSGHYTVIINAFQLQAYSNRAKFSVNWKNSQFAKMNVDLMLRTMRDYIPTKDYKYLEGASDSARKEYFVNYWKERNPTPGSKRNELFDEFNRRVEFANNHFAVNALKLDGWETDRGKIYIKYGPPTNVERNVEQINMPPYEIWYYQHLNRRFIFEDKMGSGNFRLIRAE
ncbi:MAG TPA: GWxTD domain-containing protein [bacterium]|nr:GWxTD domain-containing protein [bacterium]